MDRYQLQILNQVLIFLLLWIKRYLLIQENVTKTK